MRLGWDLLLAVVLVLPPCRADARPDDEPSAPDAAPEPSERGKAPLIMAAPAPPPARQQVTGPTVAGPTVTGPTVAGPTVAGPTVAGPTVAGPTVAGEMAPDRQRREALTQDGAGPRVSFGVVRSDGLPDGYYGRFETEYFEVAMRGARRHGPVVGALLGLEGWGGRVGGGGGITTSAYGGYRQPLCPNPGTFDLFVITGLGWHWLIVDHVAGETGVGIFAPLASAAGGLEFGGVRLLGEASAQYRWQWGASDRPHYKFGGILSLHAELWDG